MSDLTDRERAAIAELEAEPELSPEELEARAKAEAAAEAARHRAYAVKHDSIELRKRAEHFEIDLHFEQERQRAHRRVDEWADKYLELARAERDRREPPAAP